MEWCTRVTVAGGKGLWIMRMDRRVVSKVEGSAFSSAKKKGEGPGRPADEGAMRERERVLLPSWILLWLLDARS